MLINVKKLVILKNFLSMTLVMRKKSKHIFVKNCFLQSNCW